MTTTDSATLDTLSQFFTHFAAGDAAAMLRLFAPDCEFEVTGSRAVPWTGRRRTGPEIKEFIRAALEDVRTEQFDVSETITQGANVVVLGRFAHRVLATGKIFLGPFALHLRVVNGHIVTYRMYEDSFAAHEAFSSSHVPTAPAGPS
jgi:ketosteroid isomerase-like protein